MRFLSWIFFMGLVVGIVTIGTLHDDRVLAGNDEELAVPPGPAMRSPDQEEGAGYWTPERLKEAEPLEMPTVPETQAPTGEPDATLVDPSQSGAGSAGEGQTDPSEENTLGPGSD